MTLLPTLRPLPELTPEQHQIADCWLAALQEAWSLARGRRLAELHDRRFKYRDTRGLEPYSAAWGAVEACEHFLPLLHDLRRAADDVEAAVLTAYTMEKMARKAANAEFAASVASEEA